MPTLPPSTPSPRCCPTAGGTLRGLDLGVRGMRVGGRRKLIVPPNLAYGDKVRVTPGNRGGWLVCACFG